MGRYASDSGGGEFQQAPIGNHVARCIRLTDLGTQHGEYQGKPNVRNQVLVTWELCEEKMDDGKPFIVSHFYTNSLNEKATLRAHLEAWRGRAFSQEELKKFDLASILGAPAMVNVIHNDQGKARVSAVAKLPKNMKAPEPSNKPSAFWIDEWDQAAFDAMSKGIKAIIELSDEFKARKNGNGSAPKTGGHFDDLDNDIPWDETAPADNRDAPPF